jgi:hypothetical protein
MMTTEEAWDRAKNDPSWVPAWKTWSQQVVTGTEGGKLRIVLRAPPRGLEEEEGREEHDWGDEELERFLQQCEVEAGWREHVDVERGEKAALEWREWEAEMTMAGVQCPRLQADEPRDDTLVEEVEAERVAPPEQVSKCPRARRLGGGVVKRKRRWRPLDMERRDGEPMVEHEEDESAAQHGAPAGDGGAGGRASCGPAASGATQDRSGQAEREEAQRGAAAGLRC